MFSKSAVKAWKSSIWLIYFMMVYTGLLIMRTVLEIPVAHFFSLLMYFHCDIKWVFCLVLKCKCYNRLRTNLKIAPSLEKPLKMHLP